MTDLSSSDHETFSYSIMDEIDRICDQFEQEIRKGSRPKIEDYLKRVAHPVRLRLLRDLVAVDFEYARRERRIDFTDYFKRFPDASEVLLSLHQEFKTSDSRQDKTPTGQATSDPTVVVETYPKPRLTHFNLLEVAGAGGFGAVWRAMDLRLQREVAVKIPRHDRSDRIHLSELLREAQTAAKLKHPNIVSVHEVGVENGTAFVVTDYIKGVNLKEWRRKRRINPFDAARLIAKLAAAVQHAHDNGVIHRDLKLSNVLMDSAGEPHVADFGLAKREARDDSQSDEGRVLGTPAYMAPEQARADYDGIDRRTDVYALGVMLYELITGSTPFRGEITEVLQQILDVPPLAPRLIKPEIPRDLEAICLKCLAKESSNRYGTAKALADDLYLFLNGETLRGIPAAMPKRVWKWFGRNRRFVLTTGIMTFLLASLSSGLMAWRDRSPALTTRLQQVMFITSPPGCEITVVAIDPETGEPDPAKMQDSQGKKTPLKMQLESGDYLVEAMLDSNQFHEVYRHVPAPGESYAFSYNHQRWRSRDGVIELQPISIPRPDVTLDMGFCQGVERLEEPGRHGEPASAAWRLPSFFVDRHEVSLADLKGERVRENDNNAPKRGSAALADYYHSIDVLESLGRRLPSTAELYYLSKHVCHGGAIDKGDMADCVLPDGNLVDGLHSGVWEWTSTKAGGPFSGCIPTPESGGFLPRHRMAGCGDATTAAIEQTGFRSISEAKRDTGFRGVRSARPRLTPQDFLGRVDFETDD